MRSTLEVVRRWLLGILLLGVVGTETELLLLKHTDGFWQLVPVTLLGVTILALAWSVLSRSAASLRSLQFVMLLLLASGLVGTIQHFRGNVAYELESNPSVSGAELYEGALRGSTPALAPGVMIQLGLIGLLLTYRHPGLGQNRDEASLS